MLLICVLRKDGKEGDGKLAQWLKEGITASITASIAANFTASICGILGDHAALLLLLFLYKPRKYDEGIENEFLCCSIKAI